MVGWIGIRIAKETEEKQPQRRKGNQEVVSRVDKTLKAAVVGYGVCGRRGTLFIVLLSMHEGLTKWKCKCKWKHSETPVGKCSCC